jgi:hypothetical protein
MYSVRYVFRNLVLLYLLRRRLCSHCRDSHFCVCLCVTHLHDVFFERLHDECQRSPAHHTRLDTIYLHILHALSKSKQSKFYE